LVIVEPSDMVPGELAAILDQDGLGGPAAFLWLTGSMAGSEPYLAWADRFDYVFAVELEVALRLARWLGPGRVGVAPLAGRVLSDQEPGGGTRVGSTAGNGSTADAGVTVAAGNAGEVASLLDAAASDPSSETALDPGLLDALIASGQAEVTYSRAAWNFLGLLATTGQTVSADSDAVAAEHSWAARLGQMVLQVGGQMPPGEAWAAIGQQLGHAAMAERGWFEAGLEISPDGWPEGQRRQDGGHLNARRRDDGLDWEVKPGESMNFSLNVTGSLPLAAVPGGQREFYVELDGTGGLDGQVMVGQADARGRAITGRWLSWNVRHPVAAVPGARRLRLAVRALGEGTARFTSLRLPQEDRRWTLPVRSSPGRVLILTEDYPSYGNIYSFGFVHTRVKGYRELGLEPDVMVVRPGGAKRWREYNGAQVLEGPASLLRRLLDSGSYDSVVVHFLKPHLWEVLADYAAQVPMTVWIHGSDIQPWWRHKHLIGTPEKQAWYEDHTRRLMDMWGRVLAVPGSLMNFVFVSQTFAQEVAEDLAKLGLDFPRERATVINNGIDTDLFAYRAKPPEQRKRIVMIRTFGTRKYGTDLAAAAIKELSADPAFGDLEFLIVGDGDLWEEDMGPLRGFSNIRFERRFMTHPEIATLQESYGVMLQPTRWDSQGVSRDEAMAAGLVVISNGVAAVPEFLSEEEGYLAGPDDSHGIAQAILDLYHHPEVFARKSAAAAARVRGSLALNLVIPREVELIRAAATRHQANGASVGSGG
jgi:glycosyltransferase involved in cell wall biosynthesis